ncbi:hypothetical protein D3C86_1421170 [compost metagenome]
MVVHCRSLDHAAGEGPCGMRADPIACWRLVLVDTAGATGVARLALDAKWCAASCPCCALVCARRDTHAWFPGLLLHRRALAPVRRCGLAGRSLRLGACLSPRQHLAFPGRRHFSLGHLGAAFRLACAFAQERRFAGRGREHGCAAIVHSLSADLWSRTVRDLHSRRQHPLDLCTSRTSAAGVAGRALVERPRRRIRSSAAPCWNTRRHRLVCGEVGRSHRRRSCRSQIGQGGGAAVPRPTAAGHTVGICAGAYVLCCVLFRWARAAHHRPPAGCRQAAP